MYRLSISIWMPHRTGGLAIIADAHRDDEKRFVVRADDKLTAFVELERAVCIDLLDVPRLESHRHFEACRPLLTRSRNQNDFRGELGVLAGKN